MLNKKNFPGLDGFVWWTGIVEDRKDPLKCGRVQVRCYAWHTDNKSLVPSDKLIWAQPIFATNAANDTYVAKEGDAIFGFFIDGDSAQMPFFFGRFPDIPEVLYPPNKGFSDPGTRLAERPVKVASRNMIDGEGVEYSDAAPKRYPDKLNKPTTSRLARNEDLEETPINFIKENIIKGIETAGGRTWDETDPEYGAEYPYNNSKESESGHYFDIDDTRKKERVTLLHRVGTMHEIRSTSSTHRKDLKHSINLVHGSEVKNIRGNSWTTIEKWTRYKSKGRTLVEINADAKVNIGGSLNVNIQDDLVIKVGGRIFLSAEGKIVEPDTRDSCGSDHITKYIDSVIGLPIATVDGVTFPTMESITLFSGTTGAGVYPNIFSNIGVMNVTGIAAELATVVIGQADIAPQNVDKLDPDEVKIQEINASCAKSSTTPEEDSFEQKMKAWLDKITAPTGGGAGAKWCYTLADGTKGCISTHHATPDSEILDYFVCLGAVSATGHENSTGVTTNYNLSGKSCKLK